jgi:L-fuconolactonase
VVDVLATSEELPDVAGALANVEGLRVVLNHGGRPKIMCGELRQWRAGIDAIAKAGDVYCKCSGLLERAGIEWRFDAIYPYLQILVDAFGPKRLMFASNWPVLNIASNYRHWMEAVLEAFARLGLQKSEMDLVMGDNAKRCYGL